jgi:hypothetical protein
LAGQIDEDYPASLGTHGMIRWNHSISKHYFKINNY